MKTIVAIFLLMATQALPDDLWPANGFPGSKPEPESPFTIRINSDGGGVIKIGEATLCQDQAIEVLKAVRRATPDSQLLIDTQLGAMGRWQQALCQFAIKAGYDYSTIWFRYDRAKTIGEIEKEKAEQGGAGEPATRAESDSEGIEKPQPESEGRSR